MLLTRFTPLSAVDASQAQSSIAYETDHVEQMSAIAYVTGTSTGTLTVQVSNDPPSVNDQPTNFVSSGQSVAITGAGNYLIPAFFYSYAWVKFVYSATNAAAGTLTVNVKTNGN